MVRGCGTTDFFQRTVGGRRQAAVEVFAHVWSESSQAFPRENRIRIAHTHPPVCVCVCESALKARHQGDGKQARLRDAGDIQASVCRQKREIPLILLHGLHLAGGELSVRVAAVTKHSARRHCFRKVHLGLN